MSTVWSQRKQKKNVVKGVVKFYKFSNLLTTRKLHFSTFITSMKHFIYRYKLTNDRTTILKTSCSQSFADFASIFTVSFFNASHSVVSPIFLVEEVVQSREKLRSEI